MKCSTHQAGECSKSPHLQKLTDNANAILASTEAQDSRKRIQPYLVFLESLASLTITLFRLTAARTIPQ
jgi:hypothetical protein